MLSGILFDILYTLLSRRVYQSGLNMSKDERQVMKMKNTYVLMWQTDPENYKTFQMKSFNTKSEAKIFAQANGIQTYDIVYQN